MTMDKMGGTSSSGIRGLAQDLQRQAEAPRSDSPLTAGKIFKGIGRVMLSVMTLGIYDLCKAIHSYVTRPVQATPLMQSMLDPKPLSQDDIRQENQELGKKLSAEGEQDYVALSFAIEQRSLGTGKGMSEYPAQGIKMIRTDVQNQIGDQGVVMFNKGKPMYGQDLKALTHEEGMEAVSTRVRNFIINSENFLKAEGFTNLTATGKNSFSGVFDELASQKTPKPDLSKIDTDDTIQTIKIRLTKTKALMTSEQVATIAREEIGKLVDNKHTLLKAIANLPGIKTEESEKLGTIANKFKIKSPEFFTQLWSIVKCEEGKALMSTLEGGAPDKILDAIQTFSGKMDKGLQQFGTDPVAKLHFASEVMTFICESASPEARETIATNLKQKEIPDILGACSYAINEASQRQDGPSCTKANQLLEILSGFMPLVIKQTELPAIPTFNTAEEVPQSVREKLTELGVKVF